MKLAENRKNIYGESLSFCSIQPNSETKRIVATGKVIDAYKMVYSDCCPRFTVYIPEHKELLAIAGHGEHTYIHVPMHAPWCEENDSSIAVAVVVVVVVASCKLGRCNVCR